MLLCYHRSSLNCPKEKTQDSLRESDNCSWKWRVCKTAWKMKKKRYVLCNHCPWQCWVNPPAVFFFLKHDNISMTVSTVITWCISPCQVQKLQNIIASRASQYNHEMKRKEREFNKLKERLNQLLVDKKEKKQGLIENLKSAPSFTQSCSPHLTFWN